MAQNLFERFSYDLGIAKILGSFTFLKDGLGRIQTSCYFSFIDSTSSNIIIVWFNLFIPTFKVQTIMNSLAGVTLQRENIQEDSKLCCWISKDQMNALSV